jgi:hypothetical protein
MRIPIRILAMSAALAAAPAMAQINVGVGGQVGGNVGVGVNPGTTIGGVTGALDNTVSRVDRVTNRTLDNVSGSNLGVATSADLTAGATVRDGDGRKIGTVQSVHGDMAVIVKGDRTMHVPIARLYRGANGLVTSLTNRELRAAASASANADAGANVRN